MFNNVLLVISGVEDACDTIAAAGMICDPEAQYTFTDCRGALLFDRQDVFAAVHSSPPPQANLAPARAATTGLPGLAAELDVDLLVLGASGSGITGTAAVPELFVQVLRSVSCCVAVAPRGFGRGPHWLRLIGVGSNGTPESEHALNVARALAAERDAELLVLSAVPATGINPFATTTGDPAEALESIGQQLHDFGAEVDLLVLGPRNPCDGSQANDGSVVLTQLHGSDAPLLLVTTRSQSQALALRPRLERWISSMDR